LSLEAETVLTDQGEALPLEPRRLSVLVLALSVLVVLTTLLLGGSAVLAHWVETRKQAQALRSDLDASINQMANSLSLPVWNFDRPQIGRILDSLMEDREVQEVVLRTGSVYPEQASRYRGPDWKPLAGDHAPIPLAGLLQAERPITHEGETIGQLRLVYTTRFSRAEQAATLRQRLVSVLILDALLTASLSLLLWTLVLRPLKEIQELALRVSSGTFEGITQPPSRYFGELASLQSFLMRTFGLLQERYAALELSEDRFRVLVDQAPEAIVVYDVDQNRMVDANARAAELFGRPVRELVGSAVGSFYSEQQPDQLPLAESIARNAKSALSGRETVLERTILTAVGVARTCEVRLVRLPSKGRNLIRASYIDITERLQSQEALRKLSSVVEQSPISILITDIRGEIEYANPRFLAASGLASAALLGQDLWRLQLAGLTPEQEAEFRARIAAGQSWHCEMAGVAADGGECFESVHLAPVFNDKGETSHLICMKVDITGRRQAEEARLQLEAQLFQAQKMEAIGQLAGGIAHDINNMLTAIMGHLDLLRSKLPPEPALERNLNGIGAAAARSRDIVAKILAFSRKQLSAPKAFDLNEHLLATRDTIAPLIGEDINLIFHPDPALGRVFMDPSQMDQILMNLTLNARDAMPGGGTLTIETRRQEVEAGFCLQHPQATAGCFLVLEVRDTGTGMDADTLARIFEPFFTTKSLGQGTGLGLSTVFGIVKQNGGFILVRSVPGQGTAFEVFLPSFRGGPVETCGAVQEPRPAAAGGTVLVVEDDDLLRAVIQSLVRKMGYATLLADSPSAALAFARDPAQPIDLLLTDVIMPEMNGRQLMERIAELRPGLPTLLMSGYPADVIAKKGILEEGFNFIHKPFNLAALSEAFRLTLDAASQASPRS
jgi:PAS domain S-box-containing protein